MQRRSIVNIGDLRRVLAELPVDMPVVVEDCQMGWMTNTALYVAPAHKDHGVSGISLGRYHQDGADNCHALLISSLGQSDVDIVDITPPPSLQCVIDADIDAVDSTPMPARPLSTGTERS
jgi:hypothetical protein